MNCKVIIEDDLGYINTYYGETIESPTVTTDISDKSEKFTLNMILTATSRKSNEADSQ